MIDAIFPFVLVFCLLAWQWAERREFSREREAWRKERSQLLDRIKPETAPPPDGPIGPLLQAVPLDDDKAWAEARGLEVAS